MKKLLLLLFLAAAAPLCALNAPDAPDGKSVLQTYSTDIKQNASNAVRLGHENFKRRLNTPRMSKTDKQIALLITTEFQPFFDKLNHLQENNLLDDSPLKVQYSQQFKELISKLSKLFLQNQTRFTDPFFLDEKAAALETVQIVQEALDQGHF